MDNEQKFWITIWKIVGFCFCFFVLSIAGCKTVENNRVALMVKGGADPQVASCAIKGRKETVICTMLASKKEKP